MLEVKIKKLDELAIIPYYAKECDAGMDLTAIKYEYDIKNNCHVYHTGLAIEIPFGYVGLIFPRSSNRKTEVYLPNSVGIIDSGYRGEILVCYKDRDVTIDSELNIPYDVNDRIAQLMILPYPQIEFLEVKELSETKRVDGCFGSSGK